MAELPVIAAATNLVAAISRLPTGATWNVVFDWERSAIGDLPRSSEATAAPPPQCEGAGARSRERLGILFGHAPADGGLGNGIDRGEVGLDVDERRAVA